MTETVDTNASADVENMARIFYNTYSIIMTNAPGIHYGDILIAATVFQSMIVKDIADKKKKEGKPMTRRNWKELISGGPKALRQSLEEAHRQYLEENKGGIIG